MWETRDVGTHNDLRDSMHLTTKYNLRERPLWSELALVGILSFINAKAVFIVILCDCIWNRIVWNTKGGGGSQH